MKKNGIILLGCIILFLLATSLLAAENLEANLEASGNELEGGQEVTVTLKFDKYQQIRKGLNAYKATLDYDKTIFEEVKQENFQCQNNWEKLQYNLATGEFVAIKRAGSSEPEDIVAITLKTKQDVKAATTEIKIKDIVTSEGERDLTMAEAKATINVIEDQTEKPEEPKPEKMTSDKYIIAGGYVERILPNTTVAQFKANVTLENVTTEPPIIVTDKDGKTLAEDSLVTTGTQIKVGRTLQYTLVVTGDTDCDGEITINDIAELKLHLLELKVLDGMKRKAADLDNSSEIDINDLAQMKLILLDLLKLE